MAAVARCIVTTLPIEWCPHCRGHLGLAERDGCCPHCLDRWHAGDMTAITDDGEEICEECFSCRR